MTAIVGILNRNGVAFAADSAATHTLPTDNRKKITNHANKVFELSKYRPVGVAICGNLSLLGLPWEDVFKLYRAKLDKGSFSHLNEYIHDFMGYIVESVLPKFQEEQKTHLWFLCNGLKNEVLSFARREVKKAGKDDNSITLEDEFPFICSKLTEFVEIYSDPNMFNSNVFEGYKKEDFTKYALETIDRINADIYSDEHCPDSFKELFTDALFNILVSKVHVYLTTTEIVFWGYGDDDFFPVCHSIKISAVFDNIIKWTKNAEYSISNSSNAWIVPYAQTDVANTVVRGVDHSLREKFSEEAKSVLYKFKEDLINKLDEVGAPDGLKKALSSFNIKPYTALFTNDMNVFIQENYVSKLMDTVSYLMKEDLADMAESLVRMTCLKRHVTTDDETVGGPVDVAVATKGDGFVWIKRKHYFSADINHHYFER